MKALQRATGAHRPGRRCVRTEFERLAQVVQAAHDREIVHRDLKPSNVMVIEDAGRLLPKLLDLGIATVHHNAALPMPWISPEALAAGIATARMQAGDAGPGSGPAK